MKLPPRQTIAHTPTPLEFLPHLTEHLGGPEIWVKRDDLTGLTMGGNKIRKLEFFVADALKQQADTLITTGAIQSNHCRQTAAVAAKAGLACVLVLTDHRPEHLSANNFLDTLLGAEIIWAGDENRESALQSAFNAAQSGGMSPYLVPYGGSNALGACAYLHAMGELAEQDEHPFDWIVLASSSGGTQAGMELGKRHANLATRILGISVDLPANQLSNSVSSIANDCAESYELSIQITPNEIEISDAYLGAGYAQMGEPEIEAIRLFAREESLLVDPVYTGRAAAGMIDLIRKGEIKPGERVLFWHTGGTPALFAPNYLEALSRN